MTLNTHRHDDLFDYRTFHEDIHLFGVGSIGSKVGDSLVRLGCGVVQTFSVYDGDSVESHNIPSQRFFPEDVGARKVEAFAKHAGRFGASVTAFPHFVKDKVPVSGVVILCLDSMVARRSIWEQSVRKNSKASLLIETRIDVDYISVFAFDPNNDTHIAQWETFLIPQSQVRLRLAGCGEHMASGPTAGIAAEFVALLFMSYANKQPFPNQTNFYLDTWKLESYVW